MPAQGCDVTRCGEAGPRKTRLLCLVDIVMELMRAVIMERQYSRPRGWMFACEERRVDVSLPR